METIYIRSNNVPNWAQEERILIKTAGKAKSIAII